MSNELRLGFHRLAERLEDPVNLGVAVAFLWAICAWLLGVTFAMGFAQVLLLTVVGVLVIVFLRGEVTKVAVRMRESHERLENAAT
jgi:hypothetical protein